MILIKSRILVMITTLLLGINVLAALPTNGTKEFTGSMANGSPTLSSFIDGFTFINTSGFNLSAEGTTGFYLANTGSSATVTVSADGTNLETFDLTATTFQNFNPSKSYSFTITGIKSDNSEVTTTFTTTSSATISDGTYTSFTGLKSFKISYSDNIIENITLDDFTISNATAPSSGPTITSTTYDASTGSLVVTGTDFEAKSGALNDVTANKFTFTGEGASTYTLTDTANVERDSSTQFTLSLSTTDKSAVNQIINKNGTSSTSGTTYNISAADDYIANVTSGDTSDATNAITVSNVPTPTITSSIYNVNTGILVVTGTNFVKKVGANNDIDITKLTLKGQGSSTRTLTTSNVEISSSTSFTVTLNAGDKTAVDSLLNKDGLSSIDSVTYNLAAAEDWLVGTDSVVNVIDSIGNAITVSGADSTAPTISTISIPNIAMKVGSVVTATITVTSDTDDYTIGSGGISGTIGGFTLGSLSKTNDTTYTTTFTVIDGGSDIASGSNIPISFTLDDSAGNTSSAYTTAISQNADTVDSNKPVISSIVSNMSSLKVGETATVTFTLSEESSDFIKEDITVVGGTLSILDKSGNIYTSTFTPTSNSTTTGTINILANKFTDIAGNDNIVASEKTISIDTVIPTVSITSDKNSMILSETATITFTLNKDSSDFTKDDITVVGASLSSFTQDGGNSKIYTATLTPDNTLTTSITLDIDANKFVDSVGNDNISASQKSIIILPSVITYSPAVNGNSEIDSVLKLEFSENIQKGAGNIVIKKTSDDSIIETIDVLNSAVSIENLPSSSVTKPTITITRNLNFDLNVSYYVTIDASAFKDSENNNYSGISDKTVWTFATVNNHAPVITNNSENASATIAVDENQTALIDMEASDSDIGQTLTYSLLGTDASLFNIDSSSGVITFKTAPNFEVKSSYSIIAKVTDDGDGNFSDTQDLTVNINNINDDPIITISSSITTNEDTAKNLIFTYTDEDTNTVTAVEKTAPSLGTISISGTTITYTPNADANGSDSFVLTFSDSNGYTNDQIINVTINAVDDNPKISTTLSNQIQNEDGKGLIIELSTTDVDTDISSLPVTYTTSSSDTSIAKAYIKNGKLIVVPVLNANGPVTISVTSTVNGLSSTKTFTYTLESVNDRPTISNISDTSHNQSSSAITKVVILDIWDDVNVTSLSASSSNTNFLVNSSIAVLKLSQTQAQLTYTISANNAGDTTVTVSARDAENKEYKESFNISVKAVNDALCTENTKTALDFDAIKLANTYQNSVTSNLNLVTSISTVCASSITWTSSDSSIIDTSGNITQGSEEKTVTVKGTITKGEFSTSKELLITVSKATITNSDAIAKLLFESIKESNLTKNQIMSKLNLIDTILGKTITWTSDNESSISPYSGYVTRASNDETVRLTATIGSETKVFELKVLKAQTTDTQIVSNDKNLLTIASLLDKNIDANNIKYNLVKPLPSIAANGSSITWASSNTSYITLDGDVIRDSSNDKYVTLTATITSNTQSDSKEFNFKILQNKIDNTQTSTFKNAVDTASGSQVTTSENGSDVVTQSTFVNSLLSAVEKVVTEESVKNILEFVDKVINVYLNTDGTSQSTLQTSDGNSSSMKVLGNGSNTNVDASGNIESTDTITNGSVKLQLKTDGSVQHEVSNTSTGKTSVGSSTIPGSNVQSDINGNIETSSEVKQNGKLYKVVISTDNTGKTTTKYIEIDLSTGDESTSKNVISPSTPYPEGNTATISQINGELYISTTVPLSGTIIIE